MKRIICVLLVALVMCLSLFCGCSVTTTDNTGSEVPGIGRFIFICEVETDYGDQWLAYDRETYIVYYADVSGDSKYVAPYQIYQNGVIYGAVYEDGEIIPVPYATALTLDTIDFYLAGRS